MRPSRFALALLWAVAGLHLAACAQRPAVQKTEPVHVEPIEGTDLSRVVLTAKAAERLDIQTAPVVETLAVRKWTVGGEVIAQPGALPDNSQSVWVRLRLAPDELDRIDRDELALVLPLSRDGEHEDEDGLEARAEDGFGLDDWGDDDVGEEVVFYVIDDAGHTLSLGQYVLVELSLLGGAKLQKVVPYAAIIYDLRGDTWVYVNPHPLVYVRQRVRIDYIQSDQAFLVEGPSAGTLVVTVGVAELYGAELGVGQH